ncbi:putative serine/threonine-protein kinase CTR1-like [Capsicum annuum]|nr:putative serine/threonine-protein kinase CTR1-like [Capsicum annuum]
MKSYLQAYNLWEVVADDISLQSLLENPTVAQIKSHSDEELKKFKAKTVIQNSVADSIFSKIIACETANEAWEKLKKEYQGSDRVRQMQILNLKRDFESLKMQEDETIAEYFEKISLLVSKIKLVGGDFKDDRIVEKILVTIPERFESKISSLEESKDLSTISVEELISALQAQEQRRAFRQDNVAESAFYAQNKKGKGFAMMAMMILTWRYPVLAAEPSSMHIANVYRGGAMRRGTPSVKYAARSVIPHFLFLTSFFKPQPKFLNAAIECSEYAAESPRFSLIGNWDISMGGVDYPHFAALVSADHNFLAYESDEYAAFYPRSLIFCRVVAITFVLLLMLRTMLPIIVGVAGDNSVILVMLLVLKAIGILLAVYVVVKTFIAVRHRRHQQGLHHSQEENELPLQQLQHSQIVPLNDENGIPLQPPQTHLIHVR